MSKNEIIKNTLKATRERHINMACKVYELKVDYSHLSKYKKQYLTRLFLEKKWLRNMLVANFDKYTANSKINTVEVKVKNTFEERQLTCLSSQMKQSVYDEIKTNIFSLARNKKSGNKIGKLKFVSQCNTINLKQYGNTYKLSESTLKLQGFKEHFKLNGVKQIPKNAEYANAQLIKKPSGYYLHVTCYVSKIKKETNGLGIGFDFGIKDNIIDSFGNKYNFKFKETKRLKKANKDSNRNYVKVGKSSNSSNKILKREYEKINNKKKDAKNKFISALKAYNIVAIQDENLKGWKSSKRKGWGRKFQYSIMGGIISDIKRMPQTVIVDRYFASTKICPVCGSINKLSLSDRIFKCSCGYEEDRDIKSAKIILLEAINKVGEHNLNLQEGFVNGLLHSTRLNKPVEGRSQKF